MTAAVLSPTEELRNRVRTGYAPAPLLKISEFADREIILTSGPLAGARWQTDYAPYQRGIMDAFHEPGVEYVAVKGSSQWGKTACAVNIIAYHIAHDPCSILVVLQTVDPMAKEFAKNRLEPVINASPVLIERVSRRRAKDATNTTLQKTFRGGSLAIAGANSAASLASRPVRVLVLDEINRYPYELPGEGNTISIALKRTTTFRRRRRVFITSSPTLAGGPIDEWYESGDQRQYFVPCIKCGQTQVYRWKQVRWETDRPETARIHCESCDYGMNDAERLAVLSRGEWRATSATVRADRSVVSFHMWEAYSPLSSLEEIVKGFLKARLAQKRGDRSKMHSWQNTTLGESVEPTEGEGIESSVLISRREEYGTRELDGMPAPIEVPQGAVYLTAGIDTQDDRLEALVVGWGPGEEAWLVDRVLCPGNTDQDEPWESLTEQLLEREYLHASGVKLGLGASCIDSGGHRTTRVYEYGAKHAGKKLFVTKGYDGDRPLYTSPSPKRSGLEKRKVPLFIIGVDSAKALLLDRLKVEDPGPGYIHIPKIEWADEELAAQLTSERLVKKFERGVLRASWVKIRDRNEMLDCYVMALVALRLLHPDLVALYKQYADPPKATVPAPVVKKQNPFIRQPAGGWLHRNRR